MWPIINLESASLRNAVVEPFLFVEPRRPTGNIYFVIEKGAHDNISQLVSRKSYLRPNPACFPMNQINDKILKWNELLLFSVPADQRLQK